MKLLLDTHALLWWLADDARLGSRARALIEEPGNDAFISVVSLWEIVVKARTGKLEANIAAIVTAIEGNFVLLDIGMAHLLMLARLPMHHRDPFDHLLIAQAIVEDCLFLSEDRHTSRYPVRSAPCSDTPVPGTL